MSVNQHATWAARRDVVVTLLGWIGVIWALLWLIGRLSHTLFIFTFAALLAYLLAPAVRVVERVMPRALAVALVYVLALGVLGGALYLIVNAAVDQIASVIPTIESVLEPATNGAPSPLARWLTRMGVPHQRIAEASQRLTSQAEHFTSSLVPLLQGTVNSLLDIALVAILSIYLVLDGGRLVGWLRTGAPRSQQARIEFLLATFERIIGGYIRGQLLLSTIIGVLVGGGMAVFHVPDALLLGILAFLLAFVPILGTLVSGAACVLLALTQGIPTALGVLAYFVLMHVIEGDLLGPRIVGGALGLHPILSILAVVTGAELFGIEGALFAAPLTGVALAVLQAIWSSWRALHPEEFEAQRERVESQIGEALDGP
jgi:predicted PurR-regulated permease PerM